jgi:hypothetical protein
MNAHVMPGEAVRMTVSVPLNILPPTALNRWIWTSLNRLFKLPKFQLGQTNIGLGIY